MVNASTSSILGLTIYFLKKFRRKRAVSRLLSPGRAAVLLLCSGSLVLRTNRTIVKLSADEVLILPFLVPCEILKIKAPLQLCCLTFTSEFAYRDIVTRLYFGHFYFFNSKTAPLLSLTSEDAGRLREAFSLLDLKSRDTGTFGNELLILSFNLLMLELAQIHSGPAQGLSLKHTWKEKLAKRFYEILRAHCRKEHSVMFYAKALFVSPGHLSKVLREVTGVSAKLCIESAIVSEALLLLARQDCTIADIARDLNFSSTSSFSKFFKRYATLSPVQYRSRLHLAVINETPHISAATTSKLSEDLPFGQ